MADRLTYLRFFPGDWLKDQVSGCSLAAQGLWLRMMFIAHSSDRYGYLSMNGAAIPPVRIARLCGLLDRPGLSAVEQYESLLHELRDAGVPEIDKNGVIYSRRMVRDFRAWRKSVNDGRKGGNPNLLGKKKGGGVNPRVNPHMALTMGLSSSERGETGGENGHDRAERVKSLLKPRRRA